MRTPRAKQKNTSPTRIRRPLFFLGLAICLAAAGLKIYKAHNAGIVLDESFTCRFFGCDTHQALTDYTNPCNNHVINSLLICLARKYADGYEHYFRIPSVISGILLAVPVMYLVWAAIRNPMVRLAILAMSLFHSFVFDLSFLARGYSFAMTAVAGWLALWVYFLRRPVRLRFIWAPIILLSAANFLAFGAMLSSAVPLVAVNLIFIIGYAAKTCRETGRKWAVTLSYAVGIPLISGISLFLLYKNLISDILAAKDTFARIVFMTIGQYARLLIWDELFRPDTPIAAAGLYALILILAVTILVYISRFVRRTPETPRRDTITSQPAAIILIVTAAYAAGLCIVRHGLGISLGLTRNNVFLLLLIIFSLGILLDRFCMLWEPAKFRNAALIIVLAVLGVYIIQNRPAPHAVQVEFWERESISAPLLRRLRQIDPDREWSIAMSLSTRHAYGPLIYYHDYGYKFRFPVSLSKSPWDVIILAPEDRKEPAILFDKSYFDQFHCFIAVNPALGLNGPIPPDRLSFVQ